MAFETVTRTFNLRDYLGRSVDARRTKVWLTTNIPDGLIVDNTDGQFRLDEARVQVADDGTVTIAVPKPTATTNPTSWQTTVHIDAPGPGERRRLALGPFTITSSGLLSDLVDEQQIPPTYVSTVIAALQAMIDQGLKGDKGDDGDKGDPGVDGDVPPTRKITAGDLMTGGGDFSLDRVLSVNLPALDERVRDTMGIALVQGTGISISVNDAGDTITISASGAGGQTATVQTFNASGTWTKPAGAQLIEAYVVAGGGGGNSNGSVGAGGGGGGSKLQRFSAADVPATVSVTIGAGGAAYGGNGGDSSFGSLAVASGGLGAPSATAGGKGGGPAGALGGNSSNAPGGNPTFSGGGGAQSQGSFNSSGSGYGGGAGGGGGVTNPGRSDMAGDGGTSGNSSTPVAGNGVIPGGGGGGSNSGQAPGAGARGRVVVITIF